MKFNLKQLQTQAERDIKDITDILSLHDFRIKYFGRKNGVLGNILKSLKYLGEDERRKVGKKANQLKKILEEKIKNKIEEIEKNDFAIAQKKEKIDVTMPGKKIPKGHIHPLSQLIEQIVDIFGSMGFSSVDGPEIETEFYNFDALNIPKDHPARDMQDTFWLSDRKHVLRTHTSSVQIRYMEQNTPPFRIIAPGRVFRNERTDATHESQFYQCEGLMVGKNISLANLKAVLEVLFQRLLQNKRLKVRFRPSYFPFVSSGVEFDVTCFQCIGKGCALCKKIGWIEIGGAGMVHKNVLSVVGVDWRVWQGFAFGIGLDRLVQIRHGISDVRFLYNGDMRFLKQF